jgi:hypothetical protein
MDAITWMLLAGGCLGAAISVGSLILSRRDRTR